MDARQIIMNYTVPPSAEDIQVIAAGIMESLPEEITDMCPELSIHVEEFPDEATEQELDIEDSYDLLALFRSGKEISPGVQSKSPKEVDTLYLYRRPLLDVWCEHGEDLSALIRQVMIEELGRCLEFSDAHIAEMLRSHYQGML